MGRGRWRGGQREGGDGEGATKGETGKGQRGGAEEGARGGGISHMKCLGGHMKCLGGTRLQIFLTLFTRATPGTPASCFDIFSRHRYSASLPELTSAL